MGIVEKMRLDGKKGFVTGAARGIGKCTAFAFAEAGADIAVVDLDLAEAEETAAEIAKATGRKVIAIKCDVTDEERSQKPPDAKSLQSNVMSRMRIRCRRWWMKS